MEHFSVEIFRGDTRIQWFRPHISSANLSSVFSPEEASSQWPSDSLMLLECASEPPVALLPCKKGIFRGLQSGRAYRVPDVVRAPDATPKLTKRRSFGERSRTQNELAGDARISGKTRLEIAALALRGTESESMESDEEDEGERNKKGEKKEKKKKDKDKDKDKEKMPLLSLSKSTEADADALFSSRDGDSGSRSSGSRDVSRVNSRGGSRSASPIPPIVSTSAPEEGTPVLVPVSGPSPRRRKKRKGTIKRKKRVDPNEMGRRKSTTSAIHQSEPVFNVATMFSDDHAVPLVAPRGPKPGAKALSSNIRMRVTRSVQPEEGIAKLRSGDLLEYISLSSSSDRQVKALLLPEGPTVTCPLDSVELMPLEGGEAQSSAQKEQLLVLARALKEASASSGSSSGSKGKHKMMSKFRKKFESVKTKSESSMSRARLTSSSFEETSVVIAPAAAVVEDEYDDEVLDEDALNHKSLEQFWELHPECVVPYPVTKCVEWFRADPARMQQQGVFRVPGSSNGIVRLQNRFLLHGDGGASVEISPDESINVVASVLKQYLFDLPEPLITQWYALMEITDDRDLEKRDARVVLKGVGKKQRRILKYVVEFIEEVASHSHANRMKVANLGMVFGITLMRPPDEDASNLGSSMPKEVVTFLVEHREVLEAGASSKPSTSKTTGTRRRRKKTPLPERDYSSSSSDTD